MHSRNLLAILLCVTLFSAVSAFAHPPHERAAGSFKRSDGTIISIVRYYVDGIIAADPVSIQFRLPDGAELAHTSHAFDAVILPTASGIEVYQYWINWLPVASRVDSFDGYEMRDITSSRRVRSPHIHFAGHWVAYLVTVGLAAFFGISYHALHSIPERGRLTKLRSIGLPSVAVAWSLFAYDILVFEPVSPLVVFGCGAILTALFRVIRRKIHAAIDRGRAPATS